VEGVGLRVEKETLKVGEICDGAELKLKVVKVSGDGGPVVAFTSSIHGIEVNGFEVMRRLYQAVLDGGLTGTLIFAPMVNPLAVAMRSVVTPLDSMNLNRVFPGRAGGTLTERIAHALSKYLADSGVEYLVDFHGGGYCCESAPHAAIVDVGDEELLEKAYGMAKAAGFKYAAVLRRAELEEELRLKATLDASFMRRGVPSILADFGSWGYQERYIEEVVRGLINMLKSLGALKGDVEEKPNPIVVERLWIRANRGGMFYPEVKLLDEVPEGGVLGRVIDPHFEEVEVVHSLMRGVTLLIRNYPPVFTGEEIAMLGVARSGIHEQGL